MHYLKVVLYAYEIRSEKGLKASQLQAYTVVYYDKKYGHFNITTRKAYTITINAKGLNISLVVSQIYNYLYKYDTF